LINEKIINFRHMSEDIFQIFKVRKKMLIREKRYATSVEFAILVFFLAVITIGLLTSFGHQLRHIVGSSTDELKGQNEQQADHVSEENEPLGQKDIRHLDHQGTYQ